MKKKVLNLLLVLGIILSFSMIGCSNSNKSNNKENASEAGESIKNGTEKIGEEGMNLVNNIKDTSMNYSEESFESDMKNKGFNLVETEDSKSYFSVSNDDYILNSEKISVYEYDENEQNRLETDLMTVTENGSFINGSEVKWGNGPHIYKKGRVVVLYDGNSNTILDALGEVLGIPLLG